MRYLVTWIAAEISTSFACALHGWTMCMLSRTVQFRGYMHKCTCARLQFFTKNTYLLLHSALMQISSTTTTTNSSVVFLSLFFGLVEFVYEYSDRKPVAGSTASSSNKTRERERAGTSNAKKTNKRRFNGVFDATNTKFLLPLLHVLCMTWLRLALH